MESEAYKQELASLVDSMLQKGLLDGQFQELQMLQDESNPGFVTEVISLFCDESGRIINETEQIMNQRVIDFHKVDANVHQLKGSSMTVGAQKVKLACIQFHSLCERKDKDGCLRALELIKNEYINLRNKFETLMKLEESIQSCDNNKQDK